MGLKIGSVFLELLADGARLGPAVQAEAQKAGDAGALTLGQRLTKGLRSDAPRAFGAAASAAFAFASKGALELENIQVDIQRETGLTADAARAASKEINSIAGRNVTALGDVAEAFGKVHNDLGLVGDEALRTTELFVKFGRATKQGPAEAVTAFDDILDAWNLTAADAGPLMDKLIVSHQKFGGVMSDSQAALAAMAPAMQAANMSTDDGIALLNLFNASGVDASKAPTMLAKAVKALKPGQELDDLIAQIGAIEDPTLKAQKAMEIFGAKAGIGMAHAIQPGMTSLDDFAISEEDAAGATEKAAEVIDSSLSGRVRKALSEAGAALRGFGADFGPALTGLASIASLAASIAPGMGGRLISAFGGIGQRAGGAFAKSFMGARVVGSISDGLTSAMSRVTGTSGFQGATGKLGKFMGSTLGKALSVGFAAVAIVEVFNTYNEIKAGLDEQSKQIGKDIGNQITAGTTESLQQSKGALETGIQQLADQWYNPFAGGQKDQLQQQLDAVNAELQKRASEAPEALGTRLEEGKARVDAAAGDMVSGVGAAGKAIPDSIAQGVLSHQNAVTDAMTTLRDLMKNALSPSKLIARDIGVLTSKELARALKDGRPAVRAEAQRVQQMAEQDLAQLIAGGGKVGREAGRELEKKLRDKNPAIRAAAKRVKAIVVEELEKTKQPAGQAGADAGEAFGSAFKQKIAEIVSGVLADIKKHPGKYDDTLGGTGAGHHAKGGIAKAGKPAIFGEEGWELAVPEEDMHVFTHQQSVGLLSGAGGGATYNVTVNNPAPEPASQSVSRTLQHLGFLGVAG